MTPRFGSVLGGTSLELELGGEDIFDEELAACPQGLARMVSANYRIALARRQLE